MAEMQGVVDDRLFLALAEELKLPLVQIARQAELLQTTPDAQGLGTIQDVADAALGLVDGFLLGHQQLAQPLPVLEPVSVSAVLQDIAHKLYPLAKQNNCEIDISLAGKYEPIMAHQKSLESALLLLAYTLISSRDAGEGRHRVLLAAHKTRHGLSTGVFDNQPGLTADIFRRGRALYGSARQALPTVSGANGAGIFVADALFRSMEAPLKIARHKSLTGLAATMHLSRQLQLV